MSSKMKAKYNKYWGNAKTINMLLLISVVLDPCHKLDYVEWCLVNSFGAEVGGKLKTKLSSSLHSLYNLYQSADEGNQDDTLSQPSPSDKAKDIYDIGLYRRSTGRKPNLKSELDRYLNEDCESDDKPLDILGWWKVNTNRFSVLANMARDILAIPVSTVASEYAFSMGGRIIDQYRSSLTPKIVEALVCTEDWLKGDFFSSLAPENFEELEKLDQGKLNIKCFLNISYDLLRKRFSLTYNYNFLKVIIIVFYVQILFYQRTLLIQWVQVQLRLRMTRKS
ncbi:hypothetical protein AHAS_Ahas15G0210600 [Arachis hypogaea]